MIWTPRVTVAAVIRKNDRYLMVEEEIDGVAVLNQPAGHLEDGESLLEACQREIREETAREFSPESVTGVYRWRIPQSGITFLRFVFSGHCGSHDPGQEPDPDILAVHWLTASELRAQSARLRSPLVMRAIIDYESGNRYPLSMLSDIV